MNLPAITFSKEKLSNINEAIKQEWLITNGLGSYASSTTLGINTRKYHGLLVAALNPPGSRNVCLSKIDEDIIAGVNIYRLGSNEFQNSIFPNGYKHIEQFSFNTFPVFNYQIDNVEVKKTIFLPSKKNAVAIIYHAVNRKNEEIKIRFYPLLTCRHYHTVINKKYNPLYFRQQNRNRVFETEFENPNVTVVCRISEGQFVDKINWVEQLYYREEFTRGEAAFDDCFQPGFFELQVPANSEKDITITFAVSYQIQDAWDNLNFLGVSTSETEKILFQEYNRKTNFLSEFYNRNPMVPINEWLNWVLLSADSFIVQDLNEKKGIIAGYPWFEPWGRDTFISLPGLMLVTKRFDEAKDVMRDFMRLMKGGIIPNFIADKTGEPIYNTVDATLWYINTVFKYVKYSGDFSFVKRDLWDKMVEIIESHKRGTMFGIRLDDDGLLMHGPGLTWMDASVEGKMVTPRECKAVEIQALWYNAIKIMEFFANNFNQIDLAKEYSDMAELTKESFNKKFWNPKSGCLYDVIQFEGTDSAIRPNQIFSVSLSYVMLNKEKNSKIIEVVDRELVTAFGLRTLSLNDPNFVGKYIGDRNSRDRAYHNGIIWPWLLGPYVSAYLKVSEYAPQARKYALEKVLSPLFTQAILQSGLGTINEIYDCEQPNTPRGCIAQAWSVAEPLRAYIEDVLQIQPKNESCKVA